MRARSLTGAGFTIVETLIFLSISGLMLVLAINAMNGKQQQTEFETGVDTLRSDLDQQLSAVSNGNYLSLKGSHCSTNNGTTPPTFGAATVDGSCTVIGEVIAFTTTTTATPETFTVLPAIGSNYVSGTTTQATNMTQAIPQVPTTAYATYTTKTTMPFGLTIDTSYAASGSIGPLASQLGAIGLFSFTSFEGGAATSNGNLNSGSSHVEIFAIPLSYTSETMPVLEGDINGTGAEGGGLDNCGAGDVDVCIGSSDPQAINPTSGLTFCVDSGSSSANYSALFTIGGSSSPDSVTDTIFNNKAC